MHHHHALDHDHYVSPSFACFLFAVKSLDYTPITTRKPVDMRYPLRLRRQGLHIELAICVTVPGHAEGAGKRLRKTLRAIAAELTLI